MDELIVIRAANFVVNRSLVMIITHDYSHDCSQHLAVALGNL